MYSLLMQELKKSIKHLLAIAIFLIAAIYITYPLIFNLGSLSTGLQDELLIAWIQNWVVHALTTNPLALFDANIYYPYHNSLAFSDSHIISSLLSIIPKGLIGEPIVTQNFTLITSLTLLGFSVYILSCSLVKSFLPSLLTGFLVIFSPAVLDKYVHTQILAIYFVPFAILFIFRFLKDFNYLYLYASLACFVLQTLNSFLPGYFILFSYLIIFSVFYFLNRKKALKVISKKILISFIISIIFLLPFITPYYFVSSEFHYTRDIRDAIDLALQPEDLFTANNFTRLQNILALITRRDSFSSSVSFKTGYLGGVFTVTAIITVFYFLKRIRKIKYEYLSLFIIAFLGLVLSLGPALHFNRSTIHYPFPIPLPYALFYYILPGFQGFRNSARFEMLFLICIAVLIAVFLNQLFKTSHWRKIIYFLLLIGVVIEYPFPMHFVEVPQKKDFPKVYSYIDTLPMNMKIVEMPIFNWSMAPYKNQELLREYYSTTHYRKMVNGGSGFSPQPWQEMVTYILKNFPSTISIDTLRTIGVTHIILHKSEYDFLFEKKFILNNKVIGPGERVLDDLRKSREIKLIKRIDNDYIFSIL